MDLSKKSCEQSASIPPMEGPPLLQHPYSLDLRHRYHPYMMHSPPPYVVDPSYYTVIPQGFLPVMPTIKLESSNGYLGQTQYLDSSEDGRSNASSPPHDDHLPDSSTKSSDSEKDLNCNTLLSPTKLLKSVEDHLKPASRPFKAINPMGLTLNSFSFASTEYEEFRKKMLSQVQNSGTTNKNMRRTIQSANPKYGDPGYVEKRKRNNEAAKRSRDARRAKEDEIAIRCAFLEQENIKLKIQLANIDKQKKMLMGLGH